MGFLKVVAVAMVLIAPGCLAQSPDPSALGDLLRPVNDQILGAVIPAAEALLGEDLHQEEVHMVAAVDAGNVEYQVLGILFGGGKIQADMQGDLSFDFHAISVERLDRALQSASDNDNVSMNQTFGIPTSRMVITAEEVRILGAGMLLAAFQRQQEALANQFVQDLLPGLRVLAVGLEWKNTQPESFKAGGMSVPSEASTNLREPPLRLELHAELQFLQRVSLYEELRRSPAQSSEAESQEKQDAAALRQRIKENQTKPWMQRDAFEAFGFNQLLAPHVEPGWTLSLEFHVPQGFTIETATNVFERSPDKRTVTYYQDGNDVDQSDAHAGIVTFSNRLLITSLLLTVTLVTGYLLRTLVEPLFAPRKIHPDQRKRTRERPQRKLLAVVKR